MHEFSIVWEMIKLAEQELQKAGCGGKVNSITIAVGKLSGANPDSVRFAYDVIAPQTRVRGAKLIIKEPNALCRCKTCGNTNELTAHDYFCPACGSGDIIIEGGRDLRLESIELED